MELPYLTIGQFKSMDYKAIHEHSLPIESKIFVADIGIPHQLYRDFGVHWPDFSKSGILEFTPNLPYYDNNKQLLVPAH